MREGGETRQWVHDLGPRVRVHEADLLTSDLAVQALAWAAGLGAISSGPQGEGYCGINGMRRVSTFGTSDVFVLACVVCNSFVCVLCSL